MYDGVLRLQLPNGTAIVDFADDTSIAFVAKSVKHIEEMTDIAIRKVRAWLDKTELILGAHKTYSGK